MRFDLYQAETALIAQEQSSLLDEARMTLLAGGALSRLDAKWCAARHSSFGLERCR